MKKYTNSRKGHLLNLTLIVIIILTLLGSSTSSLAATTPKTDPSSPHKYAIMQPDQETLIRWQKEHLEAPKAKIDPEISRSLTEMEENQIDTSMDLLGHLDYIPSERNQGTCGNCWVWSATGISEIANSVQEGIFDRLSIQFLNSCSSDACCGGNLIMFSDWYNTQGFMIPWDNANAAYADASLSCGEVSSVNCGSIGTTPRYNISSISDLTINTYSGQATAIANIKNILHQNKGVWWSYLLPHNSAWEDFGSFWRGDGGESETTLWRNVDNYCGQTYDSGGGGHAVLIVGYNDSDVDPDNHYWIVLNSWGTADGLRPNGLFRIPMYMNYDCTYSYPPYTVDAFGFATLDINFSDSAPSITLDPQEVSSTQVSNTVVNKDLQIGNTGGSDLNWEVYQGSVGGQSILPLNTTTPIDTQGNQTLTIGDNILASSALATEATSITPPPPKIDADQVNITHSTSQTITAGNSIACSPDEGATTTDNQYLRTFTLADFGITQDFDINQVSFGIENLSSTRDVTVNLYTLSGAFTYANLTNIGTTTTSLTGQSLSIVDVPISGTAPAGSTLVVEVAVGDFSDEDAFFIGSNSLGQTAPSYLASASCGLTEPTDTADLGSPNMHIVMNVTGTVGDSLICDAPGSVSWVDVAPLSGVVSAAGSQVVDVDFDSTAMTVGDYSANLCISSNDPDHSLSVVPLSLTVQTDSAPSITLDPQEVSSTQVSNTVVNKDLQIGNTGGSDLNWEVYQGSVGGQSILPLNTTTPIDTQGNQTLTIGDNILASSALATEATSITPPPPKIDADQVNITHSTSQTITAGNSIACSPDEGATTTDNQYLRTFTLADFGITQDFDINQVSFGIENLSSTRDVTVNLYTLSGAFTYANLTNIGTTTTSLTGQSLSIVDVPISGTAPAGSTLVVEVAVGDFSDEDAFFIGSNSLGQTAPSYLASASCGLTEPTDTADLGSPNMHIVMNVTGTVGDSLICDAPGSVSWVDVAPLSGVVSAAGSQVVDVDFDSTAMTVGDYSANLCISSNDPDHSLSVVPLSLTVQSATPSEWKIYLPIILGGRGSTSDPIVNGDFEQGHTGWTEYSSGGYNVINENSDWAQSGSWHAFMGGYDNARVSIDQTITIPAELPYLHFWIALNSEETCESYHDAFIIYLDDEFFAGIELCQGNNLADYIHLYVDLSTYAGQSVNLKFFVGTNESYPSILLLDTIYMSSSTSGTTSSESKLELLPQNFNKITSPIK